MTASPRLPPRTFPGPVIKTEIDIGITRAVIIDPGTEKIL
jgi:hypothetical protein